jgi:hypothetical protein
MLLAAAGIVWISDALAQFGGTGGGFGGGLGGSRMGRGSRGGEGTGGSRDGRNERLVAAPDPASVEQVDYRISLLQDDLKLTQAQYPLWQSFSGKVRQYALDLARERNRNVSAAAVGAPQTNGLQAIGQAVDAARNRLAALEEVEVAAKALYAVLSEEQKTQAEGRLAAAIGLGRVTAGALAPGNNLPDLGVVPRRTP